MIKPSFDHVLVSAIIPVYNGERYLKQAIESVLAQTYPSLEIIVVDDGSTDGSASIAKTFGNRVRYLYQNNQGAGSARNTGIREAKGTFLTFLDADDRWVPEKVEWQMNVFKAKEAPDILFGYVKQFFSPELSDNFKQGIDIPKEVMPGFHVGTLMVSRLIFETIGNFKEDCVIGEFIDWYARAKDLGYTMMMLPEIVMQRRIHKTNQGITKRTYQLDYVRLLKGSLIRKRKSGFP